MPFPVTHPALASALAAQGYAEPTPVQSAVLEAPAGRDLLVSAQTGSGKTVAFGLAAAQPLLGEADRFEAAGAPLALAIAPTRELALQVAKELTWLYAPAGVKIATCVGGMDARREQRALSFGAHIVVGTPGRLKDHLERGNLDLSAIRVAVLDEADEMLDMGFREDLEEILDATPPTRTTLLFSATLAKDIVTLARRYQNDAFRIDTVRREEAHADIEYRVVRVAPNEIENAVVNVLRYFEAPGALVFCATREAVRHLYGSLRERGFSAVTLSGELSQKDRSDALQALRDGHARICVATDVAARGLDLPDLSLVIHAEIPMNKAALLHRSGRTGRAGRKGVSVLIAPHNRRRKVEMLLNSANIEAEWAGAPTADEIRAKDQLRMLEDPVLNAEATPEDLELGRRLLAEKSAEEVAAALVRMHRSRLPEPEEMFDAVPDYRPGPREYQERERVPYDRDKDGVGEGASWFRLPIGREKNADPKWLIPLICRLGHVTKKDIGSIRTFPRETKFEISHEVEPRFLEAIRANAEGDMRIEPTAPPSPRGTRPPREPRGEGRPFEKKPYEAKKPYEGKKPFEERKPYEGKKSFDERKPYEGKKPFEKKVFDKPADGEKPFKKKFDKSASSEKPFKKTFDKKAPRTEGGYRPELDRAPQGQDKPWKGPKRPRK